MDTANHQTSIISLSDAALLEQLEELARKENHATVELLFHLAEVEKRKLYLEAGYSSLFSYCTEGKLRYSEPAAMRRINCARLVARFPELAQLLRDKVLTLSSLSLASSVMNEVNKDEIIAGICGKSRRGTEQFLSSLRPKESAVRERVKPVAVVREQREVQTEDLFASPGISGSASSLGKRCPIAGGRTAEPSEEPKPEQRFELRFSVDAPVMRKIEEAKSLLSGKFPEGVKLEHVFAEAVEVLLEKRSPKRRLRRKRVRAAKRGSGAAATKTDASRKPSSRHIPQAVRDSVYVRDGGQCTFVSSEGVRCKATHDLEFHHVQPFAKNGCHEEGNLTLLCRAHNLRQAEKDYGLGVLARATKTPNRLSGVPVCPGVALQT